MEFTVKKPDEESTEQDSSAGLRFKTTVVENPEKGISPTTESKFKVNVLAKPESGIGDRLAFEAKDAAAKVVTGFLPGETGKLAYKAIRPKGDEASYAGTTIDMIRNAPAGIAQAGGMVAGEGANLLIRSAAPASPTLRTAANETGQAVSDAIQSIDPVDAADPRSSEAQRLLVEGVGPGIGQYTSLTAAYFLNPSLALSAAPLMSRFDFRESALDRGATEQEADMSAALGAVVSPLELVSPSLLKASLGKTGFMRKSLDYLTEVGVEAAQEAFMEGLKNLDANTIQQYNTDVQTFEGVGEAAAVGGTTAAIVNGMARLLGIKVSVKENSDGTFEFEADPLEGELLPPEEEIQAVKQMLEMDDLQGVWTREDEPAAGGGTPQIGMDAAGVGSTVPSPSQSPNVGQRGDDTATPDTAQMAAPPYIPKSLPLSLEPHILSNKAAVVPMLDSPQQAPEVIVPEGIESRFAEKPPMMYDGLDERESMFYGELINKVHSGADLSPQEFESLSALETKTNEAVAAMLERELDIKAPDTTPKAQLSDIRYDTKRLPNPQTKTPQFKKWFKESKVVDDAGEPIRLYHGTTSDIKRFDSFIGAGNTGATDGYKAFFFTSSPKVANGYAAHGLPRQDMIAETIRRIADIPAITDNVRSMLLGLLDPELADTNFEKIFEVPRGTERFLQGKDFVTSTGANVMPVYLSLQNPLVIDFKGDNYSNVKVTEAIDNARESKLDGVILKNIQDSFSTDGSFSEVSDVYITFKPEKIKSAVGNIGRFDSNDPQILRAKSPSRTLVANGLPSVRQQTIQRVIQRIKRQIPGLPEIIVYDSQSQLARAPAAKEARDPDTKGFYLPGSISGDHQIYINADAHSSDREVQETLIHELVTHYGLRFLIASPNDTPEQATKLLEPIMLDIYRSFKEEVDLKVMNERAYKIDLGTDAGKALAAEEWVASVSETMRFDRTFKALWNRLVTLVMQRLRKYSRVKDWAWVKKIKRAEVEDLLQKSFDNLKKQPRSVDVRAVVKARAERMDKAFDKVQNIRAPISERGLGALAKDSDEMARVAKLPQMQGTGVHSPIVILEALQEQNMPLDTVNYPVGRVYMAAGEKVYLGSALVQDRGDTIEIVRLQARTKALAAAIVQKEFKRAAQQGKKRMMLGNAAAFGLDLKQLYGESAVSDDTVLIEGLALEEVVLETVAGMAMRKEVKDKVALTKEELAISQYRFDKYNAFTGKLVNLVQISTTNRHVPGVNEYFTLNLQVHGYRKEILGRTERLLERMKDLSALDQRDVFNAMLAQEAYYEETGEWIIPSSALTRIQGWSPTVAKKDVRDKFVKRFKLNEEKIGFMDEIADNLFRVLEELESLHVSQIQRIGIKPETIERDLAAVQKRFNELKQKPYLPRMRFGDHTVRAVYREDKGDAKAGQTYTYEAFPTLKEARERAKNLETEGYNVVIGKQNLSKFRGIGMLGPEFLELVKDTLDMTDEQKEQFKELTERYSNVRGLAKHFEQRKGVKGYSREWTRVFASYMMQAAYGMANVKYRPAIAGALNRIVASTTHLQDGQGNNLGRIIDHATQMEVGTRADIAAWYQRHFDYMMSPDAEIATLNSLAFINFLWAVPKSALVNLSQLPVMTFPYLGNRYGHTKTAAHLIQNLKYLSQWKENPKYDWSKAPAVRQAIEAARREGILDETLMRQIANAANGLEVSKQLSKSTPAQWIQEIMIIGGIPFNAAEKFNRLMTFVTAFTLEDSDMKGKMRDEMTPLIESTQNIDPQYLVEKQWGHDPRYIVARSAVNSTQFLFGKLNRPEVFRGSLLNWLGSMLTPLFGIAWSSFKDKAALGIIGMIALLSGTEGIPFIQYNYTAFDIAATKFLEQVKDDNSGWQLPVNSRMAVRQFQRDMLGDIIDNPDIISTGLLGPEGVLNVASSIEMGDPFYLAQAIRDNTLLKSDREKESLTDMIANSFTVLSMANDYHRNIFASDKSLVELGPLAFSNVAAPFKWAEEGGVYTQGGMPLIEFGDDYTPWNVETVGKMFGFAPPTLTQNFELYQEQNDAAKYWMSRRADLMNRAKNARTDKKEAAVNAAIDKFNAQIPDQKLRLQSAKVIQLQMMDEKVKAEQGLNVPAYSRDRYSKP